MSYVLKHRQDIFFLFLAYKTLRAIVRLFFSNFFQSYFSDGKFIPTQLYIFRKGLICVVLHDLTWLLWHIENIYLFSWQDLLLLFCFLSSQENLYMIQHDLDLFYDMYNKINGQNQRQTKYLSWILNYFDIFFGVI